MSPRVLSVTLLFVCLSASVFVSRLAVAADSKTETVITIDGMHCEVCAQKVTQKLEAVKEVASVKIDVKSGKATVVPAKDKTVSAKALWEAVETVSYTPTKLEGPSGTFTKKPKS